MIQKDTKLSLKAPSLQSLRYKTSILNIFLHILYKKNVSNVLFSKKNTYICSAKYSS